MKVILTANVENLGNAGEVVNVAKGYARNFLLPRDLALEATPGNLKVVEQRKGQFLAAETRRQEEAEVVADRLSEITIKIKKKVGEKDVLYGSVTTAEIAEKLAAKGVEMDKRKMDLETPIKTIGLFEIPVRLHPEVTGLLKVQVEGE
jgi:large subunit ribosomal protein L9